MTADPSPSAQPDAAAPASASAQDGSGDGLETRRRMLHYRSWRRGTREMDFLLGGFADRNLAGFDAEDLDLFAAVTELPDPDLYGWKAEGKPVPEALLAGNRILAAFLAEVAPPLPGTGR